MREIVEREINGRKLSIETGVMGKQANGSVSVRYEDTVIFCAVTAGDPPPYLDFFPLSVDYREKTFAAGKIPGGFFKREGRPTTKEILTARLVDRPIRPLFPKGYRKDLSVSVMALSADRKNDPDILAMIGASAALSLSDLPFLGPIGAVRMGLVDGELIVNPIREQRDQGDLDLVIAGTRDAVTMVEAGAREVSEETVLDAIDIGSQVIRTICEMIDELASRAGRPKVEVEPPVRDEELARQIFDLGFDRMQTALKTPGKHARRLAQQAVADEILERFCPEPEDGSEPAPDAADPAVVKQLLEELKKNAERDLIVNHRVRTDGRSFTDIRDIDTQCAILPRTHGSALFTRGETQALAVVTLGTSFDEQRIDGLDDEIKEKFMLHYNFPAFCVGESWPNRGPKRREIGHGNLAERALKSVLPDHDDFPYTVRIVSEIMESNGSSSMASVCGGTLALMDAGVAIRQPVAGIAMGLIKEGDEVCILSDILGSEDHNGDLDFKVAGTGAGITALQMDMKVAGIDRSILETALEQAKEGRLYILREMLRELRQPRAELSPLAPRILRTRINPEKIGIVIGPGGKMIKSIQEETGAKVEIEDDGTVTVWGTDAGSAEGAVRKIEMLTEDVQIDRIYKGRVVSIKDWGAFVEVLPGQEGLLHVSELGAGYVKSVADAVSFGDEIEVKVIDIDPQGRIRLSRRAVLEERGELEEEPQGGRPERGREGGDRGRGDRGRGDRDRGDRDRGDRGRGDRDRGGRGGRRGSPAGAGRDSRGPRRPSRDGDRRR